MEKVVIVGTGKISGLDSATEKSLGCVIVAANGAAESMRGLVIAYSKLDIPDLCGGVVPTVSSPDTDMHCMYANGCESLITNESMTKLELLMNSQPKIVAAEMKRRRKNMKRLLNRQGK